MTEEASRAGELAIRYKNGDLEAGEQLVLVLRDGLLAFLSWKFKGHPCIEDAVQEAFVRAMTALLSGSLEDPRKFKSFLWATAKFVALEMRRGGYEEFVSADTEWVESVLSENQSILDLLDTDEMVDAAVGAIDSLKPPQYAELLKRRYLHQIDKVQTCEELGMTPKSYDQKMSRARGKFLLYFKNRHPRLYADWKSGVAVLLASLTMFSMGFQAGKAEREKALSLHYLIRATSSATPVEVALFGLCRIGAGYDV